MFSILNVVYNFGSWLMLSTGLYTKKANTVIIGLDNAGKTTLLQLLKTNRISSHIPTTHPNKEVVTVGNITFNTFDLGGHVATRRLWKNYFINVDCIIFVVDTSDYERFPECRKELNNIISDMENTPILVLGNKIDRPTSCSRSSLSYQLGINEKEDIVGLFMCSIVKKVGIKEGFAWLSSKI